MHFARFVNNMNDIRAFELHLEIAFSNSDPCWNQTHLLTLIFQICRDIHSQKTEYLSTVRHKIKNCKLYFGSEKTEIEYTCYVSFFFFFFFVQYILDITLLYVQLFQ